MVTVCARICWRYLESVSSGEVEPETALETFSRLTFSDLGFARPDLHRELRQGAPEAVLAEVRPRSRSRGSSRRC